MLGQIQSTIRAKIFIAFACLVISTAIAVATEIGEEHLVMGNPSKATIDKTNDKDFLMRKAEYVLSFNNETGCPNWVSWHLNASWIGNAPRKDRFRPDPDIPEGWLQVRPKDYDLTGFDQGHMCDSKDRTRDAASNLATFFMTNMVPQAPRNNEQTWKALEAHCQELAKDHELYIVAGPAGKGGEGKKGKMEVLSAEHNGKQIEITVPAVTWKVVLVLPKGRTCPKDATMSSTTIAVIMPNDQKLSTNWKEYIVTIKDVEKLTGYTFFSEINSENAKAIKTDKYRP